MILKRKQYVVDKSFQYGTSLKMIILPLITLLLISAVLIYFANVNNDRINEIVDTQHSMIEMFLETPALYNSDNEVIRNGEKTFKNNIGKLVKIKEASKIVLYFLIIMTIVQTIIIFTLSIFFTHKISGPIFVMSRYLKEIKEDKVPEFRPLRDKDEFKEFYQELQEAIEYLIDKGKK
jgi:uncharacterized protein YxeA